MVKYKYPLGILPISDPKILRCDKWAASAISINPIKIKNESPKICNDGCLLMKLPTGFAKIIIIRIDITTAMTIISSASLGLGDRPLVIPTAVNIESNEKTILITAI